MFAPIQRVFSIFRNPNIAKDKNAIRIGILGAAKIAPVAIIYPSYKLKNVQVVAVAARNQEKAKQFAQKYGIPKVHKSYQDLLNDPEIDAVYNPLPNGLHHKWTCEALKCGKHVLCEKPFAANSTECEEMKSCAEKYGKSLVEAVHWRYHPLASRMKKILTSGELGNVKQVSVEVKLPKIVTSFVFSRDNIRWNYELAGGACMDAGFYVVNAIRFVTGKEPIKVNYAKATLRAPQVDERMEFELQVDNCKANGVVDYAYSGIIPGISIDVKCEKGELYCSNFMAPFIYHYLQIKNSKGEVRTEKEYGSGESTYFYQLEAFANEIQKGIKCHTDAVDAVKNQRVIDQIYEKAGLKIRGK